MKNLTQNEKGHACRQAGGIGLWVILALAIGIAAFLMLRQPAEQSLEVAGPALSEEDTTTVIEEELQATDLGNLDADINSLDADINQL
ncbi:MAG: hypothetical protein AAB626_01435 [Patescibacteria group bacterium]